MKRNATTLFLECPNAILPTPWTGIENVIDNIESTYQSPTKEVALASWQAFVASGQELEVIADPVPTPLTISANPKSFYEKLIGVEGECSLFTIYQSILQTGLNPNIDSSSLNFAITVLNNALNNNDWTKPYAKPAYLEAYNILKMFLTQEQIEVIDQENINFNLV